ERVNALDERHLRWIVRALGERLQRQTEQERRERRGDDARVFRVASDEHDRRLDGTWLAERWCPAPLVTRATFREGPEDGVRRPARTPGGATSMTFEARGDLRRIEPLQIARRERANPRELPRLRSSLRVAALAILRALLLREGEWHRPWSRDREQPGLRHPD